MMVPVDRDDSWRTRFGFGIAFMTALNFFPLWLTWGTYGGDGYECVGLPFSFWMFGGMGGQLEILPHWFLVDAAIAVIVAKLLADLTRGGLAAGFRRLRTWGTPWAE